MNKKAQANMDLEELIKLIIFLPILLAIVGVIFGTLGSINQKDCPECENCTPYKQNLSNLSEQLEICKNQSKEIVYVNQTIEVEKKVPELIGSPPIKYIIIEISLLLALVFSITLFKFKWSEKIEKKIEKYEKVVRWFKIGSVIVSILIFIRLFWILIRMF